MAVKYIIKDIISKIGSSWLSGLRCYASEQKVTGSRWSLTYYGHMMLCAVSLEIRHFIYIIIVHSVAIGYQLSLGINL